MLSALAADLKERLKFPLPGLEVQRRMAARPHPANFSFKHSEKVKQGSVLILLYPGEEGIHLPLILRPEYDGAHGGQVSLPGGKREDQDKDLLMTALRETQEEIGVDISGIKVLGTLSELYIIPSNFNVLPVVAYTELIPRFVPDPIEVEKVITANLEDFFIDEKKKRKDLVVRETFRLDAPYYDIDDHIVWGATAMIMSEFEEVLRSIGYGV